MHGRSQKHPNLWCTSLSLSLFHPHQPSPTPTNTPTHSLILTIHLPNQLGCMEAAQQSVGCNPVDFVCGCSGNNPSAIRDNAINCVIDACGISQAIQVQEQAEQLCTCAGMGNPGFSTTSAA